MLEAQAPGWFSLAYWGLQWAVSWPGSAIQCVSGYTGGLANAKLRGQREDTLNLCFPLDRFCKAESPYDLCFSQGPETIVSPFPRPYPSP